MSTDFLVDLSFFSILRRFENLEDKNCCELKDSVSLFEHGKV